MFKKISDTINRYRLLEKGDRVCIGVSGGVDSVSLLDVLNRLKKELSLKLIVCHLNHGLRGKESLRDERFVRKLARSLRLGFAGKRLSQKEIKSRKAEGIQAWAREKRMEFMEAAAKRFNADKIALGHTKDDNAETILMRFIKGSAARGLSGIKPKRGKFIRPLIEASRDEVERYAEERGLIYVVDSSNESLKYLRNRIRLELLPFIKAHYNPNIRDTVVRCASILEKDEQYLSKVAGEVFSRAIKQRDKKDVTFDRRKLLRVHDAINARVFLMACEFLKRGVEREGSYGVEVFLKVLRGRRPNAAAKLHEGLYVKREYDCMTISVEGVKPSAKGFEREMKVPGMTDIPQLGCSMKTRILNGKPSSFVCGGDGKTAYFDFSKLHYPLKVRTYLEGDRMRPMGMEGHKKLKDIFIDEKIPLSRRKKIPLVVSASEIIWAAGVRQSECFKILPATKKTLVIELRESGVIP